MSLVHFVLFGSWESLNLLGIRQSNNLQIEEFHLLFWCCESHGCGCMGVGISLSGKKLRCEAGPKFWWSRIWGTTLMSNWSSRSFLFGFDNTKFRIPKYAFCFTKNRVTRDFNLKSISHNAITSRPKEPPSQGTSFGIGGYHSGKLSRSRY